MKKVIRTKLSAKHSFSISSLTFIHIVSKAAYNTGIEKAQYENGNGKVNITQTYKILHYSSRKTTLICGRNSIMTLIEKLHLTKTTRETEQMTDH